MHFFQNVMKSVLFPRAAALALSLVVALMLQLLPSTALALGIPVSNASTSFVSSDSSKVTAPTNKTVKKYACTGALTVDTTNVTKVQVPCGLPYDQKIYACPAGQVIVSTGSEDKGYNSLGPWSWGQCTPAATPICNGNSTNYSGDMYIGVYCRAWCRWIQPVIWVTVPTCYIGCAPQTMPANSCQWQ
jgi:hypothetical protein